MNEFFPQGIQHYLFGGLIMGAAIGVLFLLTGLVGGMSTVFTSSWSFVSRAPGFSDKQLMDSRIWRLVYAAGLICGGFLYLGLGGDAFQTAVNPWRLGLGGFLIGFGARLGKGCTAGHGICGMASLQWPSMVAVMIFLSTAIGVAHAMRALGVA